MLVRAASHGFIRPTLPSPAERPPSGPGWVHEIKHDGFRMMVRRDAAGVRLFTRNGHDWTGRYPLIAAAVGALMVRSCLIDGEAVACGEDGMPAFDRLRYRRQDGAVFLLRWAAQIGLQFNEHIAEPSSRLRTSSGSRRKS